MRALLIAFLCLSCYGAEITLSFLPKLEYVAEAGHEYNLWTRSDMNEPWTLMRSHPSTNFSTTVTIMYHNKDDVGFFWLQKDGEELITPMPPTNSPSGPPPTP